MVPLTVWRWIALCLFDQFRTRALVGAKLLRSKCMSTGAASPLCVRRAGVEPSIFAGMKCHHQLTAAFEAMSSSHSDLDTTSLAALDGHD